MSLYRPAAVAGSFYAGDPLRLAADVDYLLANAAPRDQHASSQIPKAIIVPHAGYIYSGPVAAPAYLLVREAATRINRVVLLGPVHRVPVRGLALPSVDGFETPLGTIPVAKEARTFLAGLHQVTINDRAHAWEHSLEVQLPFLQRVLGEFELVPLAVGDASAEEVCQVLDELWGGPETLIVISSDLSHYLPYDSACRVDRESVRSILELRLLTSPEQACGATPVNGIITAARRRGLTPKLVDIKNSGDTAGDKGRVVGYASIALYEGESQ